jgi:hypothetical protein
MYEYEYNTWYRMNMSRHLWIQYRYDKSPVSVWRAPTPSVTGTCSYHIHTGTMMEARRAVARRPQKTIRYAPRPAWPAPKIGVVTLCITLEPWTFIFILRNVIWCTRRAEAVAKNYTSVFSHRKRLVTKVAFATRSTTRKTTHSHHANRQRVVHHTA